MKRVKVGLAVSFAVLTFLYSATAAATPVRDLPAVADKAGLQDTEPGTDQLTDAGDKADQQTDAGEKANHKTDAGVKDEGQTGHEDQVPDKNQIIITKIIREIQTEIKSFSFSELVVDINNCTYQPTDPDSALTISKNVEITANNIIFEDSIINGDLYIRADNVFLRNIVVNGTVHIRPLSNNAIRFENVTFVNIAFIREPAARAGTKASRGTLPEDGDADEEKASARNGNNNSNESRNGRGEDGSNETKIGGGNSNPPDNGAVTAYLEQASIDDYDSYLVVINKDRSLPDTWKPKDLVRLSVPYTGRSEARYMREEASDALNKLFAGAKKDGIILRAVSGFRSYELQKVVFAKHEDMLGTKAAEMVSARPGLSEHQTGLAIDISSKRMNYALEQSFGNTPEGRWLAENAAKFGFILRYPKGKESITGYEYEPWHFRYVGKDIAADIMKKGLTLEEYFGLVD